MHMWATHLGLCAHLCNRTLPVYVLAGTVRATSWAGALHVRSHVAAGTMHGARR